MSEDNATLRICADCRGTLSDWNTTEGAMFMGICPVCESQETKRLYTLRAGYLSSAIKKIRAREEQIPKAWWDRLRSDVDNILEAESKRDPLATLGVLGFVKKCMARIEKGE